ncbi:unnamed protein product, partial [Gongylonema pulchrum]|uniref:adenylate cyclase n=1 Tax=Gongylonema pulchrum TaxID=637853 RepID=A0A183EHW4_9BILA
WQSSECAYHCINSTKIIAEPCDPTINRPIYFESVLLILLSVCVFNSFLALEKILLSLMLCLVALIMLWITAFPGYTSQPVGYWDVRNVPDENIPFVDRMELLCSDLRIFFTFVILFAFVLTVIQSRRSELIARFDFIWKLQALDEGREMEKKHSQNRAVLENILPAHVAEHFLKENPLQRTATKQLSREEFKCIEKIKTISTTYMAASGLFGEVTDNSHVVAVTRFAIRLLALIQYINEHSFNSFNLRIGINVGPVVAGVIGVKKPHYDIWGNSVNVASRMDSSGVAGRIQVPITDNMLFFILEVLKNCSFTAALRSYFLGMYFLQIKRAKVVRFWAGYRNNNN